MSNDIAYATPDLFSKSSKATLAPPLATASPDIISKRWAAVYSIEETRRVLHDLANISQAILPYLDTISEDKSTEGENARKIKEAFIGLFRIRNNIGSKTSDLGSNMASFKSTSLELVKLLTPETVLSLSAEMKGRFVARYFAEDEAEAAELAKEFILRCEGVKLILDSHLKLKADVKKDIDIHRLLDIAAICVKKKSDTKIVKEYGPDVGSVYGIEVDIFRILTNLIKNASEESALIRLKTSLSGGNIEIAISDSGRGLPREKAEAFNLGQPVASSKEGPGHGFGLSIVRDLTGKNGGTVSVSSEPGIGTTFRIGLKPGSPAPAPGQTEGHAFKPVSKYSIIGLGGGVDWIVIFGALVGLLPYVLITHWQDIMQLGPISLVIFALVESKNIALLATSSVRVASSVRAIRSSHPDFNIWQVVTHDIGHDEASLAKLKNISPYTWYQIKYHEMFRYHISGLFAFIPQRFSLKRMQLIKRGGNNFSSIDRLIDASIKFVKWIFTPSDALTPFFIDMFRSSDTEKQEQDILRLRNLLKELRDSNPPGDKQKSAVKDKPSPDVADSGPSGKKHIVKVSERILRQYQKEFADILSDIIGSPEFTSVVGKKIMEFMPNAGQEGEGAYWASPVYAVATFLEWLGVGPEDNILEVGSADATLSDFLSHIFGMRSTGVEVVKPRHDVGVFVRDKLVEKGYIKAGQVTLLNKNFNDKSVDFSKYSIIYHFAKGVNRKRELLEKMLTVKKGARILILGAEEPEIEGVLASHPDFETQLLELDMSDGMPHVPMRVYTRKAFSSKVAQKPKPSPDVADSGSATAQRRIDIAKRIRSEWKKIVSQGALVFDVDDTLINGGSISDSPEMLEALVELINSGVRVIIMTSSHNDLNEFRFVAPLYKRLGKWPANLEFYTNRQNDKTYRLSYVNGGLFTEEFSSQPQEKNEILRAIIAIHGLQQRYIYYIGDGYHIMPFSDKFNLVGSDLCVAEDQGLKDVNVLASMFDSMYKYVPKKIRARLTFIGENVTDVLEFIKLITSPVGPETEKLKPSSDVADSGPIEPAALFGTSAFESLAASPVFEEWARFAISGIDPVLFGLANLFYISSHVIANGEDYVDNYKAHNRGKAPSIWKVLLATMAAPAVVTAFALINGPGNIFSNIAFHVAVNFVIWAINNRAAHISLSPATLIMPASLVKTDIPPIDAKLKAVIDAIPQAGKSPSGIKGVFFDVGGVLVYSDFPKTAHEFAKPERGFGVKEDDVYREIFKGMTTDIDNPMGRLERGEITTYQCVEEINEKLKSCGARKRLTVNEYEDILSSVSTGYVEEMMYLANALREKGYEIAINSNTNDFRYAFRRKEGRLLRLLGGDEGRFYASHITGVSKPDVRSYLDIADHMRLSPGSCLMIDDRQDNIEGAIKAGLAVYKLDTKNAAQGAAGIADMLSRPKGSLPITGPAGEKVTHDNLVRFRELVLARTPGAADYGQAITRWSFKPELTEYHPEGARCELGHNINWQMVLVSDSGSRITLGPDCIVNAGIGVTEAAVDDAKRTKTDEIRRYKEKLAAILRTQGLTGTPLTNVDGLRGLLEPDGIGDAHFALIDKAYTEVNNGLQILVPDCSVERLIEIVDGLKKLEILIRGRRLGIVSDQDALSLQNILNKTDRSETLSGQELGFLIKLNAQLLARQNLLIRQSLVWARRGTTAVDLAQEARTPAYHANLWIAKWVASNMIAKGKRPLILDTGANLSVFWRVFRGVLGSNLKPADDVVDLERDRELYLNAMNPARVRADISDLGENLLPKVHEATDDLYKGLVSGNPHSFNIINASFVFDQLQPHQIQGALIAIENLLITPPPREFSAESLCDFPLLIIALPEHSLLAGSLFEKAMHKAGYTPVVNNINQVNRLSAEARNRLVAEIGPENAALVESATAKPFHVAIYAKTRTVGAEAIRKIPLRELGVRDRQIRTAGENPSSAGSSGVDIAQLLALDAISTLKPADFDTKSSTSIPLADILTEDRYAAFAESLASLSWLKSRIVKKQEAIETEATIAACQKQGVRFLAKEQVEFVIGRAQSRQAKEGIKYTDIIEMLPHLKRYLDEDREPKIREIIARRRMPDHVKETEIRKLDRQVYSFLDIFRLEECYRRDMKCASAAEEVVPLIVSRTIAIRAAVARINAEGRTPSVRAIARQLNMAAPALTYWYEHHMIDIEALGAVFKGYDRVDMAERLKNIDEYIAAYKKDHKGKGPNQAEIADHLGLHPSSFLEWCDDNDIDLEARGAELEKREAVDDEKRVGEIEKFVGEYKGAHNGNKPPVSDIARQLGLVSKSSVTSWVDRLDDALKARLRKLDIFNFEEPPAPVNAEELKKDITEFIALYRATHDGEAPNRREIAEHLGRTPAGLAWYLKRFGIDLKTLGANVYGKPTQRGHPKKPSPDIADSGPAPMTPKAYFNRLLASAPNKNIRIMFVCVYNAARTASMQMLLENYLLNAGLSGKVHVSSAGVADAAAIGVEGDQLRELNENKEILRSLGVNEGIINRFAPRALHSAMGDAMGSDIVIVADEVVGAAFIKQTGRTEGVFLYSELEGADEADPVMITPQRINDVFNKSIFAWLKEAYGDTRPKDKPSPDIADSGVPKFATDAYIEDPLKEWETWEKYIESRPARDILYGTGRNKGADIEGKLMDDYKQAIEHLVNRRWADAYKLAESSIKLVSKNAYKYPQTTIENIRRIYLWSFYFHRRPSMLGTAVMAMLDDHAQTDSERLAIVDLNYLLWQKEGALTEDEWYRQISFWHSLYQDGQVLREDVLREKIRKWLINIDEALFYDSPTNYIYEAFRDIFDVPPSRQPFEDGNHRAGCIVLNYLLMRHLGMFDFAIFSNNYGKPDLRQVKLLSSISMDGAHAMRVMQQQFDEAVKEVMAARERPKPSPDIADIGPLPAAQLKGRISEILPVVADMANKIKDKRTVLILFGGASGTGKSDITKAIAECDTRKGKEYGIDPNELHFDKKEIVLIKDGSFNSILKYGKTCVVEDAYEYVAEDRADPKVRDMVYDQYLGYYFDKHLKDMAAKGKRIILWPEASAASSFWAAKYFKPSLSMPVTVLCVTLKRGPTPSENTATVSSWDWGGDTVSEPGNKPSPDIADTKRAHEKDRLVFAHCPDGKDITRLEGAEPLLNSPVFGKHYNAAEKLSGRSFTRRAQYQLALCIQEIESNSIKFSEANHSLDASLYKTVGQGQEPSYILRYVFSQDGAVGGKEWRALEENLRGYTRDGPKYLKSIESQGAEREKGKAYFHLGHGLATLGILMEMTSVVIEYKRTEAGLQTTMWIKLDDLLEKPSPDMAYNGQAENLEGIKAKANELKRMLDANFSPGEANKMIALYLNTYSYQSLAIVESLKGLLGYGLPKVISEFFSSRNIWDKTRQSNILEAARMFYTIQEKPSPDIADSGSVIDAVLKDLERVETSHFGMDRLTDIKRAIWRRDFARAAREARYLLGLASDTDALFIDVMRRVMALDDTFGMVERPDKPSPDIADEAANTAVQETDIQPQPARFLTEAASASIDYDSEPGIAIVRQEFELNSSKPEYAVYGWVFRGSEKGWPVEAAISHKEGNIYVAEVKVRRGAEERGITFFAAPKIFQPDQEKALANMKDKETVKANAWRHFVRIMRSDGLNGILKGNNITIIWRNSIGSDIRIKALEPLDADMQNAIALKNNLAKLYAEDIEKTIYTIRIDTKRVSTNYVELVKKYYAKILSSDKVEVRVIGNDKINGLVDVTVETNGRNQGNGTVDLKEGKDRIESLGRLVGMVNLAMSVASLPEEFIDSGVDKYRGFLDVISNQYESLTGEKLVLPANPKDIASFIRNLAQNLPPVKAYGVKAQDEFRLMEEKLKVAA